MAEGLQLISDISIAIQNNNEERLHHLLDKIPFDDLNEKETLTMLNIFLETASTFRQYPLTKVLLARFEELFPSDMENIPYLNSLFYKLEISEQSLMHLAKTMVDIGFVDVVEDLIEGDDKEKTAIGVRRALKVFGPQSVDVYRVLHAEAKDKGNTNIQYLLEGYLEEKEDLAPIPSWVLPKIVEDAQIEIPDYIDPFPGVDLDQKVEELLLGFDLGFKEHELDRASVNVPENFRDHRLKMIAWERAFDIIRARVNVAEPLEKMALLPEMLPTPPKESTDNYIRLFQLLGPANPFFPIEDEDDRAPYGGSRMFLSTEFELDEDGEQMTDWFDGVCEACHKKVLRRWHTVRIPGRRGGWKGSYCSEDCLYKAVVIIETKEGKIDPVLRTMLESIFRQLRGIGIIDRIERT